MDDSVQVPLETFEKLQRILREIGERNLGGKQISGPDITEHFSRPYPNPIQEAWENRLVARHHTMALHGARFLGGGELVAQSDIENQFILGSALISFVAFADSQLEDYLSIQGTPLSQNKRLFDRIEAVQGSIPNAHDMHDLRKLRNELAHDLQPPSLDWDDIDNCITTVEACLTALGVISPAPTFTTQGELSQMRAIDPGHGERDLRILVFADGQPFAEYRWLYQWLGTGDPGLDL